MLAHVGNSWSQLEAKTEAWLRRPVDERLRRAPQAPHAARLRELVERDIKRLEQTSRGTRGSDEQSSESLRPSEAKRALDKGLVRRPGEGGPPLLLLRLLRFCCGMFCVLIVRPALGFFGVLSLR
eukprot:Amastigsp_a8538_32.p1 type:complete len:125 gc:universal Amastigsp_a8538_32:602-228(-)